MSTLLPTNQMNGNWDDNGASMPADDGGGDD